MLFWQRLGATPDSRALVLFLRGRWFQNSIDSDQVSIHTSTLTILALKLATSLFFSQTFTSTACCLFSPHLQAFKAPYPVSPDTKIPFIAQFPIELPLLPSRSTGSPFSPTRSRQLSHEFFSLKLIWTLASRTWPCIAPPPTSPKFLFTWLARAPTTH